MFFLFEQQKVGLFVFSKEKWFESSSFKGKLYLKSSIKSFKKKVRGRSGEDFFVTRISGIFIFSLLNVDFS